MTTTNETTKEKGAGKIQPVPTLELEDDETPEYCDLVICCEGAVIMKVLNADSLEDNYEDGFEDVIDAQARATADKVIKAYNSYESQQSTISALVEALQAIEESQVLYSWANEKNIGQDEWKRRSEVVESARSALAQIKKEKV